MATTGESGLVGGLVSNGLADYDIFAVLLFYILKIAGLFVLRRTRAEMERPYKVSGHPVLPALYITAAGRIASLLLRFNSIWRGEAIVWAVTC
jgi:basic amino acid/polyamine antiporter, APA family